MSTAWIPTGNEVTDRNLRYLHRNYEQPLFLSSSEGAISGYQIIDDNKSYVGMEVSGALTWVQVA